MTVLKYYSYIVIANVILSWLVAFNVLNTQNRFHGILFGDYLSTCKVLIFLSSLLKVALHVLNLPQNLMPIYVPMTK